MRNAAAGIAYQVRAYIEHSKPTFLVNRKIYDYYRRLNSLMVPRVEGFINKSRVNNTVEIVLATTRG